MRALLALVGAAAIAAGIPATSQPIAPPATIGVSSSELGDINAILLRWEKAWEDGDAVAWSNMFHEDGTWVLWTGGEWHGRAEIAGKFAEPLATVYKDSVQRIRLMEARKLSPGVIVVRMLSNTIGDARQPGVTIYGNKMLVLTWREGRWGILYGQNTRLNEAEIAKLR